MFRRTRAPRSVVLNLDRKMLGRFLAASLLTASNALVVRVAGSRAEARPLGASARLQSRTSTLVCAEPTTMMPPHLHVPEARDSHYADGNLAQYLVDLHDAKATFNFCGGMMFQLILSDKLREHLASGNAQKPVVFDADAGRMSRLPGYSRTAEADNAKIFHGREVRQVPTATGGMGFAIHLSKAGEDDPEGWTAPEVEGYDGWAHDAGRIWRTGETLEKEGFAGFRTKFGDKAYTLHHRFYLHLDRADQLWLSAEDGCEGHPAPAVPAKKVFGLF